MAESKSVTPQTAPDREWSLPAAPDPDQQTLAILDRAALEMADRTPPGPAAEPAGTTEDAGAQTPNPSEPYEPPSGTQNLAQHNPAAEDVPAEIMKLAEQMKPAQDMAHVSKPIENADLFEEIKPAEQFQLVEQFDPMTIVSPSAPVAPAQPKNESKIESKIVTKATPPPLRTMFDDHFRLALTSAQSFLLAVAIFALLIGAFGMAAYGWVTAHDLSCRLGLLTNSCPPSEAPKPLVQPEIPT